MTDAEKAQEAKAEAFFAKIPDPPKNTLVAAEEAHADAEEADGNAPTPKAAAAASSSKETAVSPAKAGTSAKTADAAASATVVDRVLAALKAGDVDALADLTDQDPADFDEKSTKWASRNRKEAKLKAEVEKVKADAKEVVDHYAPLDESVTKFHATKDYALVKSTVEFLFGEDFDSLIMKTFRAVRGQDPRVPELSRALAAKDEELTTHRTKSAKAADVALREALRDDLPDDHQVRKLPDWEEKVAAVLRESVDEDTGDPALSFKQAAQRVLRKAKEQYEKYASAFGDAPATPRGRAETPERAAPAAGAKKRPLTKEEFFASFDR